MPIEASPKIISEAAHPLSKGFLLECAGAVLKFLNCDKIKTTSVFVLALSEIRSIYKILTKDFRKDNMQNV